MKFYGWIVLKYAFSNKFQIIIDFIISNIYRLITHLMQSKATFIGLLLLISCVAAEDYYRKIIHGTDPQAKCLDGSSPMIYLHEGGDTKNILFYFIGGGACMGTDLASTLESCYKRSKGQFGTSSKWPETYNGTNGGIL